MEVLSLLSAKEIPGRREESSLLLDEYEMKQIRKVPRMLADDLFGLPTIAELARKLALNRNKLMGGFKQLYGDTIFSYHRNMCLGHAAALLLHTSATIHEIALDVGYSNASNFCSAFKKKYGMTPQQYRHDAALSPSDKGQIAT